MLSQDEFDQFERYCNSGDYANADQFGFPGRGLANSDVDKAPQGGFWWWNGLPQYWPNLENQQSVLQMAQSAYFLGVVVARWADLLICKTRTETIFRQVGASGVPDCRVLLGAALVAASGEMQDFYWLHVRLAFPCYFCCTCRACATKSSTLRCCLRPSSQLLWSTSLR